MQNFEIKKNVPLDEEEKPRKKWPFGEMQVNDVIDVDDASTWKGFTRYAHTIANRKGWKIITHWLKDKGIGRIRRIS